MPCITELEDILLKKFIEHHYLLNSPRIDKILHHSYRKVVQKIPFTGQIIEADPGTFYSRIRGHML